MNKINISIIVPGTWHFTVYPEWFPGTTTFISHKELGELARKVIEPLNRQIISCHPKKQ